MRRLLAVKSKYETDLRAIKSARSLGDVCTLERMVVAPAMQGHGIGTRALRQVLREADAAGWPTLLATNEERNVKFYEQVGFEVVEGVEGVEPGRVSELAGEMYKVWYMLRRPSRKK